MATATASWTYNTSTQSWVFTGGSGSSGAFQATDGSPASGCLQATASGKNRTTANYWELTDTWVNLFGLLPTDTVTAVGGGVADGYVWKCSNYTTGAAGCNSGPFELRTSGSVLTGTFSVAQAFSGTTAWSSNVAAASVSGLSELASTTRKFRLRDQLNTGNSGSATVVLRQDTVVLTVTYTSAPAYVPADTHMTRGIGTGMTVGMI